MMGSIEQQAALIVAQVMTWIEKDQAAIDVSATDRGKWNCARLAVRLLEEVDEELEPQAVYQAVAKIYDRTDSTVRRMVYVARDVSPAMVAGWPLMTFSLWKVARDAKHIEDKTRAILEVVGWVYDYYDQWGQRPSTRTVEGWVYGETDRARAVWRSRTSGVVDQLVKIKYDPYCPPELKDFTNWVQIIIQEYLKTGAIGVLAAPAADQRAADLSGKEVYPPNN